jgi:mannose-1-phosphate guanylyltransferase / mannose-6-phosphate isomerase
MQHWRQTLTTPIIPVILCGGSGTRLWPLSRKSYPKQFVGIIGEGSLFQQSALRLTGPNFKAPIAITNSDFRFIVTQQLAKIGVDPGAVLIEPEARNTAPALLAAALVVAETSPQSLLLAAPSDHLITEVSTFHDTILKGIPAALAGQVVTFGIVPNRPETGYGYLESAQPAENEAVALRRFIEKPSAARAAEMLAQGGFLWNAGIFLYTAETLIAAFEKYMPEMLASVRTSVAAAKPDLGFLRLEQTAWRACEDVSIDYAIMEKIENISVVAHNGDWTDLGGWEAVRQKSEMDSNGLATSGAVTAIDCRDTLLRSEAGGLQLVGLGLENIVAIAMPDAVLVASRDRVQDVGSLVKILRKTGVAQADAFPKDHRPWGFFETLILSARFQVKRIVVNPGAALSLQSHMHRAEHWIVVSGTAEVTVDDKVSLVTENQSIFIPLGSKHRMSNPGKVPMELIEVQTGSYLGEDDIQRYEDVYARGQGAKG